MRVYSNLSISTERQKISLFGVKTVEIEVKDVDVYVNLSTRLADQPTGDFKLLYAGQRYLFKAPKGKLFYQLFACTTSGTATLNVFVSEFDFDFQRKFHSVQTLDSFTSKTSTFAGNSFNVEKFSKVSIFVTITSVSGTSPTLNVKVQISHDGSNWYDANYINSSTQIAFTQFTAVGQQVRTFEVHAKYLRLYYTIGGTSPSFTGSSVICVGE